MSRRRLPLILGLLVRIAVAALLVATLLLAGAQQQEGSSPWWLELSRYLPYPVYLAPPALALLLSLGLGRWWAGASLAALALTAVVTMDLHWQPRRPDLAPGSTPLRLMTYNVKAYVAVDRSGGLDALAREVALRDPDILLLQDATDTRGGALWNTSRPLFGLPHVYAAQQYIVASRLPLRDCQPRATRPPHLVYVSCAVSVGGRTVNLVTAHFVSPRSGLVATRHEGLDGADEWRENYQLRLLQSQGLTADLAGIDQPLIVAGDLNAPDASPVVRNLLATGLRDAFAEAGSGYGYSYGQALKWGFSFLRIDHILVSRRIHLRNAFVGNAETSDHRPVVADLVLAP